MKCLQNLKSLHILKLKYENMLKIKISSKFVYFKLSKNLICGGNFLINEFALQG